MQRSHPISSSGSTCAHVLFKAFKIFRENGCKPGKTPIAGWARWAPTTAPGAITKGMARYSRKTQCSPSATLQCAFEKSFCWRLTWRPPESFQVLRFRLKGLKGLKGLHWPTGNLHIRAKEGPNSRLNDIVGPTFQDKSCQSLLTRWPGGLAAYSLHKPHPSPAGRAACQCSESHLLDVTASWLHAPADMFKWFWYRPTKPIGRYVKYGINHMRIHCPKMPCNCLLPDGNNQHRKNGLRERESIHRPASTPHAPVLDFNASLLILLLTAAQLQLISTMVFEHGWTSGSIIPMEVHPTCHSNMSSVLIIKMLKASEVRWKHRPWQLWVYAHAPKQEGSLAKSTAPHMTVVVCRSLRFHSSNVTNQWVVAKCALGKSMPLTSTSSCHRELQMFLSLGVFTIRNPSVGPN